jgi:hypothetical protein
MVRRRRVGVGVRSREMSHWIVGSRPVIFPGESSKFVLFVFFFSSGGDGNVRTPYAPECTRVPDDTGQLRELRRQRARRFSA